MSFEISVVIPAYNIEDYLDECMDSLMSQTFNGIEIIVINDGSTDATAYMLQRYQQIFDNLTVINQANSGSAGGPRNLGISRAKGKYIFFLDPDDTLPLQALEIMYKAINKSNADFVCGNYCRSNSKGKWTNRHTSERLFNKEAVVNIQDEPYLLNNIIAWNKLYNLNFIKKNQIYFNEGKRYGEDRNFVIHAYLAARSIHIIPDIIYTYRQRESVRNKSATQEFSLKTFEESVNACVESHSLIEHYGRQQLLKELYSPERVQHDYKRFIDYYSAQKLSGDHWKKIEEISKGYLELLGDHIWELPYVMRKSLLQIKYVDGFIRRYAPTLTLRERLYKISKYGINDYFGHNPLDVKVSSVSLNDLLLCHGIEYLKIKGDNLIIKGWAFLKRFNISSIDDAQKYIVFKTPNSEVQVKLENTIRRDISLKHGKGIFNYKWAGFEQEISLITLLQNNDLGYDDVKLYLRVYYNEKLYKEIEVSSLDLLYKKSVILRLKYDNRIMQRCNSISHQEKNIVLNGWAFIKYKNYYNYSDFSKKIILIDQYSGKEYSYSLINTENTWCNTQFETNPYGFKYNYAGWTISLPYADIPTGHFDIYIEVYNQTISVREKLSHPSWNLIKHRIKTETPYINFGRKYVFEYRSSEYNRNICDISLHVESLNNHNNELSGGYVPIVGSKSDYWDVTNSTKDHLLVKKIIVTKSSLGFSGTYINSDSNSNDVVLILENTQQTKGFPCKKYEFKFNSQGQPNCGWHVNIPFSKLINGNYIVSCNISSDCGNKQLRNYQIYKKLKKNNEVWKTTHYIGDIKLEFQNSPVLHDSKYNVITFNIVRSKKILVKGIMAKSLRKLRKIQKQKFKVNYKLKNRLSKLKKSFYLQTYRLFCLLPVRKDKVVFATYNEHLTPNFRSIDQTLLSKNKQRVHFYGNNKSTFQLIIMAYHFATATSVVVDSYYRHLYDLKHRKKTKFIQVWHATGIFKNFALLAVDKNQTNTAEFERKAHHYYTHVIVSGDEIIEPYAKAFGISTDRVLPLGVPRTDLFFEHINNVEIPKKVVSLLPQIKGKKVILYAPTFRGDDKQRKRFRNQLDFNQMEKLFQVGYILLVKLHPSVKEPLVIPSKFKDKIIDVTAYSDINELFFVTDVLITDYSSSVFEYSLFNRPIIFFAYDLSKYLQERGFYFSYEEFVPGPIVTQTQDITEIILNMNKFEIDHTKFKQKYLNSIDGNSTERLINLLLNERDS